MNRFIRLVPLAFLVLVAGCGGAEQPPPSPSTSSRSAGLSAAEQSFVDRVAGIAPPLAENPDRLARRGGNTCDSLADGRSRDEVVAQAVERFSGSAYTVTTEQAAGIVEAAEQTVCAG